MRRKRRRHNPPMMRLMKCLVNKRMMKTPVNPINQTIRKHQKQRELKHHIPPSIIRRGHVEHRVPTHFSREPRRSQDGHDGHRLHRQGHFLADLRGEKFRVVEVCLVKDKVV